MSQIILSILIKRIIQKDCFVYEWMHEHYRAGAAPKLKVKNKYMNKDSQAAHKMPILMPWNEQERYARAVNETRKFEKIIKGA